VQLDSRVGIAVVAHHRLCRPARNETHAVIARRRAAPRKRSSRCLGHRDRFVASAPGHGAYNPARPGSRPRRSRELHPASLIGKETPCEELYGGDIDPGLGAGDGGFEVFGKASVPIEPSEGAFDDPATRQEFEADGVGHALDLTISMLRQSNLASARRQSPGRSSGEISRGDRRSARDDGGRAARRPAHRPGHLSRGYNRLLGRPLRDHRYRGYHPAAGLPYRRVGRMR
jgi:hypothetical protein